MAVGGGALREALGGDGVSGDGMTTSINDNRHPGWRQMMLPSVASPSPAPTADAGYEIVYKISDISYHVNDSVLLQQIFVLFFRQNEGILWFLEEKISRENPLNL